MESEISQQKKEILPNNILNDLPLSQDVNKQVSLLETHAADLYIKAAEYIMENKKIQKIKKYKNSPEIP